MTWKNNIQKTKPCANCGGEFTPAAPRQLYCSDDCHLEKHTYKNAETGCWNITSSRTKKGYGMIKGKRAHRLSWEVHNGPIPEGLFVCHRCDDPSCVNPDHLFLGTPKENMADMIKKARDSHPKGEANHSKITEAQAVEIIKDTRSSRKIGADYGINHKTVLGIKKGVYWAHLQFSTNSK